MATPRVLPCDWRFLQGIGWFTNNNSRARYVVEPEGLRLPIETPVQKYLFCLTLLVVFALAAEEPVRSATKPRV